MKFYTIANPNDRFDAVLKPGFNEIPFDPKKERFQQGGVKFYKNDILAIHWCDYELFEVDPLSPVHELPGHPKVFKAQSVHLKKLGKVRDKIEFLIKKGANVHACRDEALIFAIEQRDIDVVKILVKHGANVNARNGKPLILASDYNLVPIIKILIKHGADPNTWGGWPLRKSIMDKNFKLTEFLIKHGADVNADNGWALWYSLKEKNFKLAKFLVSKGADINLALSNFKH
jgi:ankyrin repeat protein